MTYGPFVRNAATAIIKDVKREDNGIKLGSPVGSGFGGASFD
jgi:hypothetical protein